eukprot:COSAG02_NODE_484_length_21389_cov_9.202583_7_plen_355_part_00
MGAFDLVGGVPIATAASPEQGGSKRGVEEAGLDGASGSPDREAKVATKEVLNDPLKKTLDHWAGMDPTYQDMPALGFILGGHLKVCSASASAHLAACTVAPAAVCARGAVRAHPPSAPGARLQGLGKNGFGAIVNILKNQGWLATLKKRIIPDGAGLPLMGPLLKEHWAIGAQPGTPARAHYSICKEEPEHDYDADAIINPSKQDEVVHLVVVITAVAHEAYTAADVHGKMDFYPPMATSKSDTNFSLLKKVSVLQTHMDRATAGEDWEFGDYLLRRCYGASLPFPLQCASSLARRVPEPGVCVCVCVCVRADTGGNLVNKSAGNGGGESAGVSSTKADRCGATVPVFCACVPL